MKESLSSLSAEAKSYRTPECGVIANCESRSSLLDIVRQNFGFQPIHHVYAGKTYSILFTVSSAPFFSHLYTYIKDSVIVRTRTNASPTFVRHICVSIITAVQTECNRGRVDPTPNVLMSAVQPCGPWQIRVEKILVNTGLHLFRAFLESEISPTLFSVYSLGLKPAIRTIQPPRMKCDRLLLRDILV